MVINCLSCCVKLEIDAEYVKSASVDCCECGFMMLIEENKVYDFHKKVHENCSEWPENGEGTGFVDL
jgi:hypothetical protein